MDNNFSWNLCDDFIAHEGRGHNENPPGRGSGRYPWGSGAKNGKTPIHEHGEKKHKSSGNVNKENSKEKSKNGGSSYEDHKRKLNLAINKDEFDGDFLKAVRKYDPNGRDKSKTEIIDDYDRYLKNPKAFKKELLEDVVNSDFNVPKNIYKKTVLGKNTGELTEEGEQFKKEIATRADAYYELMDDKNFNERLENYKERREALSKMNGKESVEDRRKYYDLDNTHMEYLVEDYNKATNNKFVGNPNDADGVAFTAFAEKYYEKMLGKSVEHSDMDRKDFIMHTSLKRALNTPIN